MFKQIGDAMGSKGKSKKQSKKADEGKHELVLAGVKAGANKKVSPSESNRAISSSGQSDDDSNESDGSDSSSQNSRNNFKSYDRQGSNKRKGAPKDSKDSHHDEDKAESSGVTTEYRDYSRDRPDPSVNRNSLGREGAAQTFPMKLHAILSNPEFSDIIAWLPHGRAWRILQTKAFEERAIPLYFRHGRYSSFARQVNGWGFRRITHGPDYNSYYHEMFLKGLPHLCEKMKRLTSKDIKNMQKDDAALPDFYTLSREFPLPDTPGGVVTQSTENNAAPSSSTATAAPSTSAQAGNLGPFAGLGFLSSLGSGKQPQQPNGFVQANIAGPFASVNQLASQSNEINIGNDPSSFETRRNEILQRMMQLAAGQGDASAASSQPAFPAPSASSGNPFDVMSLLNSGMNKQGPGSFPLTSSQVPAGSNFKQRRPASPPAAQSPTPGTAGLNPELLALAGQQGLNPSILANLAQAISNPSANNSNPAWGSSANYNNPAWGTSSAFPLSAASSQQSSFGMGGQAGLEFAALLLQQQAQGASSGATQPNLANAGTGGNIDLAALLRQHQQTSSSTNSGTARPPTVLSPGARTNAIPQQVNSASSGFAGGYNAGTMGTSPNLSGAQTLDLASLLRLQQQQQQQQQQQHKPAAVGASYSGGNNSGGDLDALSQHLGDQNAALLLQLQAQATGGSQQQQTSNNNLSMLLGNAGAQRSQGQNIQGNNTESGIGNELQYLQQVLSRQHPHNNTAQNTNQLEAVMGLLLNSNNANNSNNNSNIFSNFTR